MAAYNWAILYEEWWDSFLVTRLFNKKMFLYIFWIGLESSEPWNCSVSNLKLFPIGFTFKFQSTSSKQNFDFCKHFPRIAPKAQELCHSIVLRNYGAIRNPESVQRATLKVLDNIFMAHRSPARNVLSI